MSVILGTLAIYLCCIVAAAIIEGIWNMIKRIFQDPRVELRKKMEIFAKAARATIHINGIFYRDEYNELKIMNFRIQNALPNLRLDGSFQCPRCGMFLPIRTLKQEAVCYETHDIHFVYCGPCFVYNIVGIDGKSLSVVPREDILRINELVWGKDELSAKNRVGEQ